MTPLRQRPGATRPPWYHRLHPATWVLLCLLVAAGGSLAVRTVRRAGGLPHRPQVQVANGSGSPELAQRAAQVLRSGGLDVVSITNADSPRYADTIVLLRRGDIQVARQVARVLGTGEVLEQLDPTLLVDVTVVLGQDYATGVPR